VSLISIRHENEMIFAATVRDHTIRMDMRGTPRCVDAGPSPAARASILPTTLATSPELDVLIRPRPGQQGS
jgi:hypothetical protein